MPSDIFLDTVSRLFSVSQKMRLLKLELDLHDGRFVDSGDLVSASLGSIVESVSGYSLGSLISDELDGLDDSRDELDL